MEASIFVSDPARPLLDEYEPLDDDDGTNWEWSSSSPRFTTETNRAPDEGLVRSLLPPLRPSDGYHSAECIYDDIYRYYLMRGLWKYITAEIGQLLLLTWLILFCIFLGTCVNYAGIIHHGAGNATIIQSGNNSIWQYIDFGKLASMSWYFITALVLFSIYSTWRIAKFIRDIRRMIRVKAFYMDALKITDFELRTARWGDILDRLKTISVEDFMPLKVGGPDLIRLQTASQSPAIVASLVTKKENFFKKLLELGHFDFVFHINIPFRGKVLYQNEFMMLTRGLQWNITYCIVNFFFDNELQIKQMSELTREHFVSRLKARIMVLSVANILLLPFLVVFVALYAVFRYGEQFYKNPGSIGTRQWSLAARWYFRDYDELAHNFEERMRLSSRFAKQYTSQFAASAVEGVARCIAFIIGSIVVWLLLLSFLNERALLGIELSPGKGLLWWITILSSVWVIIRGMLQEQYVFYPKDALHVVYELTRRLPAHFMNNAGSQKVLTQFYQLFPLQIYLLVLEFVGLIITPWILLKRIYPNADKIVKSVHDNLHYTDSRHFYLGLDVEQAAGMESVADYKEDVVLRSENLVPYIQKLDTAAM